MSDSVLIWIVGGQWCVIALLGKLLWDHTSECRSARERAAVEYAALHETLKHVVHEIGDGERGLRGNIHKLRGELGSLVLWADRKMEDERRGLR